MIELNSDGKKIKRSIVKYLKQIKQYNLEEIQLIVHDTCVVYQEYVRHLEIANEIGHKDENFFKHNSLSSKNYINYTNALKSLGIGVMSRKKLSWEEEVKDDHSILSVIAKARG